MIPLNEQEKNLIRNLVNSPQWKIILRLADLTCERILETSPIRDTQWKTLPATFDKEFQVKGIRHFIREFIENQ